MKKRRLPLAKLLFSSPKSLPSARILRDEIERLSGERLIIYANEARFPKPPAIRYGNSGHDYGEEDTEYNSPAFIRLVSSKKSLSDLLSENEIYTPIFYRSLDDLSEDKFPVLVRTSLSLSGGAGITLCKDRAEFDPAWQPGYWWTPYIRTEFELRVHVLGGEIMRIFRKNWNADENGDEPEFPIRNNKSCHFSLKSPERYGRVANLIERLNGILGENNFYALDLGWDSAKKDYLIFEANSAPGLNEHTAELYARFLCGKLGIEIADKEAAELPDDDNAETI